jgi:hypothetical protein
MPAVYARVVPSATMAFYVDDMDGAIAFLNQNGGSADLL